MHPVRNHAPSFADIDLVGPVSVVGELIPGESPLVHPFPDVLRYARVVGEEPEESLLVGLVLGDDFATLLVGPVRVLVVVADIVEGKATVVVGVRLAVDRKSVV